MDRIVNIADLVDHSDPQGRTFRQINLDTPHNIPIGALVELESGVRLFVVQHSRDCDGTPLYEMSADKNDTVQHREGWRNSSWIGGYHESCLSPISPNLEHLTEHGNSNKTESTKAVE